MIPILTYRASALPDGKPAPRDARSFALQLEINR